VLFWRAAGATGVMVVLCMCRLICVLRLLQILSGFPLGYLGDP
jgi:hypothetical protein